LIGPLKSQKQLLEIENLINGIVEKEGVTLFYSGKRKGSILEPIVLENVCSSCKLYQEDIYAPIIILEAFSDI
jgi:glyceraldehyde-3-phosphate dehydrogenase (NADP+)